MVSPQISVPYVSDHCMLCKGDVAQLCRQTQSLLAPPPPLSIQGVFSVLWKIRYGLNDMVMVSDNVSNPRFIMGW